MSPPLSRKVSPLLRLASLGPSPAGGGRRLWGSGRGAAASGLGAGVLSGTCSSSTAVWVEAEEAGKVKRAGVSKGPEGGSGGSGGGGEAGRCIPREGDTGTLLPRSPPREWGWKPGWHLEALAHCPGLSGTQATAGQHAACPPVQEGPPVLSTQGSDGCRDPGPALEPRKREGILGGALGPQPSQPRILALKGTLDTEGAARPATDLAKAWALMALGLGQGQGLSCGLQRWPS